MLRRLEQTDLIQLLERIAVRYLLLCPKTRSDGTRLLQPWDGNEPDLAGPLLHRKPSEWFFPQTELLLTLDSNGAVQLPASPPAPLALLGLQCADLAGIAFLDRFFLSPPLDDAYLSRRQDALLIGMSGHAGKNGEWLPLLDGDCDLELIISREGLLSRSHSATGVELLQDFACAGDEELAALQQASGKPVASVPAFLQQAARLLQEDKIPEAFWEEIAARCICCGGCNFSCPTCSCFGMQDWTRDGATERSRVWDSCQLDAFMREASGHNPLGTEALRTRRRIYHKLVADPLRHGELGCVACGRCDRACPTGIGMFALCEEMVKRYGPPSVPPTSQGG